MVCISQSNSFKFHISFAVLIPLIMLVPIVHANSFLDILRNTKLSAQIPEKTGRSGNFICENTNSKPENLTSYCSKEGTESQENQSQNSQQPQPSQQTQPPPQSQIQPQQPAQPQAPQQPTQQPPQQQQTTQAQTPPQDNFAQAPQPVRKGPTKLEQIYQALYVAQAQVQLEVKNIQRAQSLAAAQQKALEDATMNVRTITGALHAAQQDVATAALRAQTAQLQLAAHDQLLFAARQKVDALSSQAVGLQAEDSMIVPQVSVDLKSLIEKLRAPLPPNLKPSPIPAMCPEAEKEFLQLAHSENTALALTEVNSTQVQPYPSINTTRSILPDQRVRDLENTINEILQSQRRIDKRNDNYYDGNVIYDYDDDFDENDLSKRYINYEDFFYKWYLRDLKEERRKKQAKHLRHKCKNKH